MSQNMIEFSGVINKKTVQNIINRITTLVNYSKSSEELTIVYTINSYGGDIAVAFKFIDYIKAIKENYPFVNFHSIISKITGGAATIIAIVADRRFIEKDAYAMICGLNVNDKSYHLQQIYRKMIKIYCNLSKVTSDMMKKVMKNDNWFSAEEYLKLGFVDEII
jgi:ATP-dependent protease ClpP protease subunit